MNILNRIIGYRSSCPQVLNFCYTSKSPRGLLKVLKSRLHPKILKSQSLGVACTCYSILRLPGCSCLVQPWLRTVKLSQNPSFYSGNRLRLTERNQLAPNRIIFKLRSGGSCGLWSLQCQSHLIPQEFWSQLQPH